MRKFFLCGVVASTILLFNGVCLAKSSPNKKAGPAKVTSTRRVLNNRQKKSTFKVRRKLLLRQSSLRRVISTTIQSNPDVIGHLKKFLAARHGIRVAQGGYLPNLDLTGEYGIESISNANTNFSYRHITPLGASLVLSQMLFDGFATSSEVARNQYLTLAEEYQLQGAVNDIALLTTKAYLDVLRTRGIVKMARDNYLAHRRIYNMIRHRSLSGLGRRADTTQALGRLALARSNWFATKNNYRTVLAKFKQLTGMDARSLRLVRPATPALSLLPRNVRNAINRALVGHPVLKAAEADIKEADAQYSAAKANNYPHLSAVAKATRGHDISGIEGRYKDNKAYLRLTFNLFNGGSDSARIRQTEELVSQAKAIRDRAYRQVVNNMDLAWNAYKTYRAQLSSFREHRDAAYFTVKAYKEQFRLGRRTLLDFLNSEDELFNARVTDLNGRYSVLLARFRILNAEGKLLDYLRVSVPR